ncbi:MAG: DNA repair protein RecO [Pseudomonadota bacterium]
MEWRDEGVLLSVRRHGESAAIIEVFTRDHGRHAGLVRGGASRRWAPVLQPGAGLAVAWAARLEGHLGTYKVEPMVSRAHLLADRAALAGLSSLTAMAAAFLPEREALPEVFEATEALLERFEDRDWPAYYVLWEVQLLGSLGYGLALDRCAVGGGREDLSHVSPRTGAAVSRDAGAAWVDRLLVLPPFLRPEPTEAPITEQDIEAGLDLTSHFLRRWLCPAIGRDGLPAARERLPRAILGARG